MRNICLGMTRKFQSWRINISRQQLQPQQLQRQQETLLFSSSWRLLQQQQQRSFIIGRHRLLLPTTSTMLPTTSFAIDEPRTTRFFSSEASDKKKDDAAAAPAETEVEIQVKGEEQYLDDEKQLQRQAAETIIENTPNNKNKDEVLQLDKSLYTHEIEIKMPDMGEGQGKVLKWYKETGDVILRRDVLCDIETPDFTFGMETDDEHPAIMGEIIVAASSDSVADGTVICKILHPTKKKKEIKKDDDEEKKKTKAE